MTDETWLRPDEPVDLDNCAREPIHIPGSIQPHGVLLAVTEPGFTVATASANLGTLLHRDDALGRSLGDVLGAEPAQAITRAAETFGDLRERNPLELVIEVAGRPEPFDAILHRETGSGLLIVELEAAFGPRPMSFPNTYLAVRKTVNDLNRAVHLRELYDITARAVRELTGFDRVMVYRYDAEFNGEVVAEAKLESLNSFLGLHYPASDIPAQARALYEKNWIRLIADVGYQPSPLLALDGPYAQEPLDLTLSTLRSVSPIHIEYLQNMGVGASMSISLLRDGTLWGLIACHHYSGPHHPPFGVRAAAEFLGSTLSLRLVDRAEDSELRNTVRAQSVLAALTGATLDEHRPLGAALLGSPSLLDLLDSDGAAVIAEGDVELRGLTPDAATVARIGAWAAATGEEIVTSTCLSRDLPEAGVPAAIAAGVLVIPLPEGQFLAWFRREVVQSVDWGGDPHNKAIARTEDGLRLSPRKSFERWRQVVEEHSTPWTAAEQSLAGELRRHTVEALYLRTQRERRLAETVQRSLLPTLPAVDGWRLSAHYETAEGGQIGGDWYDAVRLRNGQLALVVGDVAGHGVPAAGLMAQLRNALRAYLLENLGPGPALAKLNDFTTWLLPGGFATAVVVIVDPATGTVTAASAGHPVPYLAGPAGAEAVSLHTSPPLGVTSARYREESFVVAPGHSVLLYSDGLIERRGEDIDVGFARLATALGELPVDAEVGLVFSAVGSALKDDTTLLRAHRH